MFIIIYEILFSSSDVKLEFGWEMSEGHRIKVLFKYCQFTLTLCVSYFSVAAFRHRNYTINKKNCERIDRLVLILMTG